MQHFLGDLESGKLILENHQLTLAIAKKTLDENQKQETALFPTWRQSLLQE